MLGGFNRYFNKFNSHHRIEWQCHYGTSWDLENTKILYFGWNRDITCSDLTVVPQGALDIFPNLIGFYFRDCSINHLNGNDLDEYENLEIFMTYNSTIEFIPGNIFALTPNMRMITFSGSRVRHVGADFMVGLNNLMHVNFFGNDCISDRADNSTVAINSLIERIRTQCQEIETTTVITTESPTCEIEDINEFVCRHDEEIEELKLKVEDLQSQINELKELLGQNTPKIKSKTLNEHQEHQRNNNGEIPGEIFIFKD